MLRTCLNTDTAGFAQVLVYFNVVFDHFTLQNPVSDGGKEFLLSLTEVIDVTQGFTDALGYMSHIDVVARAAQFPADNDGILPTG